MQRLILPIFHTAHLPGEDVPEHEVDGTEDLPPGTEVPGEEDLTLLPLQRLPGAPVGLVFPQEDPRVRQAEAVDALLHVSHGEEVLSLSGNGRKDPVLDLVGVLILVHQDLPVPGCHLPGKLRGPPLPIQQDMEGQVLLVGEIRRVAAELFLPVILRKALYQVQQRRHGRGHGG